MQPLLQRRRWDDRTPDEHRARAAQLRAELEIASALDTDQQARACLVSWISYHLEQAAEQEVAPCAR